jgi:asparagine synthase (glutamine-hydrolysing)
MEESITEEEFERERNKVEPPLRTCEEVAYYRIFAEALNGVKPQETLGRFATV